MKLKLFAVLSLMLAAVPAFAQPQGGQGGPGGGPGGGRGMGRLVEQFKEVLGSLELSAEQTAKTNEILDAVPAKMQKLMEETADLDRQERGQRMREAMEEVRGQVEEQLTAEQKEKFAAKLEEVREQARQRMQQGQGQGQGQGRGMNIVGRLEEAIATLNLTGEQKEQADKIVAELRTKADEIRAAAANDPQAAREQAREASNAAREELVKILTPEQREKLRETMQAGGQGQRGEGRRGEAPPNAPDKPADPPATRPSSDAGNTQPTAPAVGLSVSGARALAAGDTAPTFSLTDLNGKKIDSAQLKQRPTLIIFGSYTSPAFRDATKSIKQLRADTTTKMNMYIIYTREAHPQGGWEVERNRDDNISIAEHKNAEERLAAAKKANKAMDLNCPVLIDTLDDATLLSFGGNMNGAVLIDREGKVAAILRNFETHAVRRALEKVSR